jgi:hypothetical protein
MGNALRESSPGLYRTLCRLRGLARPPEVAVPEVVLAAANTNDSGIGVDHRHFIMPGDQALDDLVSAFADGIRTPFVVDRPR